MKKATENAYSGAKDSIISQLATVLVQAKSDIPTRKNSPLVELQIFNGVTSLRSLKNDEGQRYSHSDSLDDFYQALAEVTEDEMNAAYHASPYKMFA